MGGEFIYKGEGNSLANRRIFFCKTDREFLDTGAGNSLTNGWRIS
jgi:hypothetical protein